MPPILGEPPPDVLHDFDAPEVMTLLPEQVMAAPGAAA
jgi:hypothetical protein